MYRRFLAGLALSLTIGNAQATTIEYAATDLADITAGQDLWSLQYKISGEFNAFEGLNLLFPSSSFNQITLTEYDASVWFPIVTDVDQGLSADGILTLTSLDQFSLDNNLISIEFLWTGANSPGSQPYELFNSNFELVSAGETVTATAVPEPDMAVLLITGLAMFGLYRRKAI